MIWFYYIFVFLLPFQNHYLLNLKLSGDFTVLKAFGAGLLLYSVGYSVFHGLPRLWRTVQSKFLFLLSAQMFLSLFFSRFSLSRLSFGVFDFAFLARRCRFFVSLSLDPSFSTSLAFSFLISPGIIRPNLRPPTPVLTKRLRKRRPKVA